MTLIAIAVAALIGLALGYVLARRREAEQIQPLETTEEDMAAETIIRRGDTVALTITIPAGQGVETLDGLKPRAEMRGSTDSIAMTAFVVSRPDRKISLSASAAQSRRLPVGVYRLVVELVATGGLVRSTYAIAVEVTDGIFDV